MDISISRGITKQIFGQITLGGTILTYDWPSNRRYKRKRWRSRCQFRVELVLLSIRLFLPLSFSLCLSFFLFLTSPCVNHGTWYPRCCGRAVSYMYTGCLVIKSPHGVVSLTSYTLSRNRCGNRGEPFFLFLSLFLFFSLSLSMQNRRNDASRPRDDTIKIVSRPPDVRTDLDDFFIINVYLTKDLMTQIFTCYFAKVIFNINYILHA